MSDFSMLPTVDDNDASTVDGESGDASDEIIFRKMDKNEDKQKFYRCELCNIRQHFTQSKYAEHMICQSHRNMQLIYDYGLWPGQCPYVNKFRAKIGRLENEKLIVWNEWKNEASAANYRKYIDCTKRLQEMCEQETREKAIEPTHPYAFMEKNDGRVYCHACKVTVNDSTALLVHQMTDEHCDQQTKSGVDTKILYYCQVCDAFIGHNKIPYNNHLSSPIHRECVRSKEMLGHVESTGIDTSMVTQRRTLQHNLIQSNMSSVPADPFPSTSQSTTARKPMSTEHQLQNMIATLRATSSDQMAPTDLKPYNSDYYEHQTFNESTTDAANDDGYYAIQPNAVAAEQFMQQWSKSATNERRRHAQEDLLAQLIEVKRLRCEQERAYEADRQRFNAIYSNECAPWIWEGMIGYGIDPNLKPSGSIVMDTSRFYEEYESMRPKQRVCIEDTLITRYRGTLSMIARLESAAHLLVDAVPKASPIELEWLVDELIASASTDSIVDIADAVDGNRLLTSVLLHHGISRKDRMRLVGALLDHISSEQLAELVAKPDRVRLLDTAFRVCHDGLLRVRMVRSIVSCIDRIQPSANVSTNLSPCFSFIRHILHQVPIASVGGDTLSQLLADAEHVRAIAKKPLVRPFIDAILVSTDSCARQLLLQAVLMPIDRNIFVDYAAANVSLVDACIRHCPADVVTKFVEYLMHDDAKLLATIVAHRDVVSVAKSIWELVDYPTKKIIAVGLREYFAQLRSIDSCKEFVARIENFDMKAQTFAVVNSNTDAVADQLQSREEEIESSQSINVAEQSQSTEQDEEDDSLQSINAADDQLQSGEEEVDPTQSMNLLLSH